MTDAAATAPRSHFGAWSLVLAAVALIIAVATFVHFVNVPNDAPEDIRNFAGSLFLGGFLIVAPLIHLVGLAFGMAALVRAGDRKGLGVLGIVLNAGAVSIGVGLVWLMLYVGAAFT
jgi:heme/copper-type cytochrome/quinol oxidase subunit 2